MKDLTLDYVVNKLTLGFCVLLLVLSNFFLVGMITYWSLI